MLYITRQNIIANKLVSKINQQLIPYYYEKDPEN